MPTIQDMGIAAAFQQTPNMATDPSILLSALALRERKRQAKADEGYRERAFNENVRQFDTQEQRYGRQFEQGVREFERSAGQRDQGLQIDRANLGLRKRAIKTAEEDRARVLSQEAAASGAFADLADHLGMFPAPEVRQRFEMMNPDDQQRAIGMFQEEQAAKEQQAKLQEFDAYLQNAAAAGFVRPENVQAYSGQARAGNIDDVYGLVRDEASMAAQQQADMQRRAQGVEMLTAVLGQSSLPSERQQQYLTMMQLEPGAKLNDIMRQVMDEEDQREQDRMAGEQLRMQVQQNAQDLLTLHPGATPETAGAAARLRGAGVPIGVGEANFTGETRQQIGEGDEKIIATLEKRVDAAQRALDNAADGKARKAAQTRLEQATAVYEREFERVMGRPFPGGMDELYNQAVANVGKGATREQISAEMRRLRGG